MGDCVKTRTPTKRVVGKKAKPGSVESKVFEQSMPPCWLKQVGRAAGSRIWGFASLEVGHGGLDRCQGMVAASFSQCSTEAWTRSIWPKKSPTRSCVQTDTWEEERGTGGCKVPTPPGQRECTLHSHNSFCDVATGQAAGDP